MQSLHLKLYLYPTRKTFAMWKIARIGQGNHKKAWEQEIRREHNSNPLQRQSHVLVVFPCFPSQYATQFSDDQSLYIYYTSIWNVRAHNHDDLWWIDVPNTCSVEHRYTHSPSMRSNMHGPYWWPAWNDDPFMWWMEADRWIWNTVYIIYINILCIVHVHDVVMDWSYALVWFLVPTLFCGSPGQS